MDNNLKNELIIEIKNDIKSLHNLAELNDSELENEIEKNYNTRIEWAKKNDRNMYLLLSQLTYKEKSQILKSVYESIRGLDLLSMIITDKTITEVMINGYDNIFVEQNNRLRKLNERFESTESLMDLTRRFVGDSGRSVTESNPIVDTRLPDGSRVNVVFPPIALNGPIITIRRFPETAMTVEKLIEYESITPEVAEILQLLVYAKYNIFVCGGTGSGKTTFLNALSNFIPKYERVITIEDSAELQIKNIDNLVRLETRNANATGTGEITIKDLIKSSLRMRPDRIVVGEVRGAEAIDMLQAMNTGHDGSLSTGHANSTYDMLSRLETMVLSGSTTKLPLEAVRQQIASAIDIIIHLSRLRDFSRKTIEITEVASYNNGEIQLNPLYEFKESKESTLEKVIGKLERTDNPIINDHKLINSGIYKKI